MKKGTPFEQAVADLVRDMAGPTTTVQQGVWRKGPDGSRDCDVLVETRVGSRVWVTLIECKDFKTEKVGIPYLDALVSKHADLNMDKAVIFSNSGFTEPAMRKATCCPWLQQN